MYTYKVMIHPNNKQETKIRRTLNKCIECNNIIYDYLDSFVKNKTKLPSCYDVRKWFTKKKKELDNVTIEKRVNKTKKEQIREHLDALFYDVSNDALKQEIKDTYNSFIRYFNKVSKYPVKKEYNRYKKSFYVDAYKIKITDKHVRLEKIANNQKENRLILNYIRLAEANRIPTDVKYYNPRIELIGDSFWLVITVDEAPVKKTREKSDEVIGIDVNINSVYTSDNTEYIRITKTNKYKKELKRFKRIQRRLSNKYLLIEEYNKIAKVKKKYKDFKNYQKNLVIKRKKQKRLNNLVDSDIDNIITQIINKSPKTLCIESLDVNDMKEYHKNNNIDKKEKKYIAKGIQVNPFRKFIKRLEERVIKENIKIIEASQWYKSSKLCSNCNNVKEKLKLSDRTYKCSKCGLEINRDYNASINLKKYALKNAY